MRFVRGAALLALCFMIARPAAFSQLRNTSEYSQDRINTEETFFVLHDQGAADFGWASEWTMYSSIDYEEKCAMLMWHFKDGSKGYAMQAKDIGETGRGIGYFISGKSSNLQDVNRKPIQPMTRSNYPVKLELWIGEIGETGFSPKVLIDTACFDGQAIQPNRAYHFSACR
jgi:hypothetical protein